MSKEKIIKKSSITIGVEEKLKSIKINTLVPICELVDHEDNNIFGEITDESVENLVLSIKTSGFTTPILVWKLPQNLIVDNKKYKIFSGHRRKRAMEILEKEKIPCLIFDYPENEVERRKMFLTSNTATRGSIHASKHHIYIAKQIKYIEKTLQMDGFKGIMRAEVARFFNVSESVIQRYKSLLNCTEKILELEDDGTIPLKQAAAISQFDKTTQDRIAAKITAIPDNEISSEIINEIISGEENRKSRKQIHNKTTYELYMQDIDSIEKRVYKRPVYKEEEKNELIKRLENLITIIKTSE